VKFSAVDLLSQLHRYLSSPLLFRRALNLSQFSSIMAAQQRHNNDEWEQKYLQSTHDELNEHNLSAGIAASISDFSDDDSLTRRHGHDLDGPESLAADQDNPSSPAFGQHTQHGMIATPTRSTTAALLRTQLHEKDQLIESLQQSHAKQQQDAQGKIAGLEHRLQVAESRLERTYVEHEEERRNMSASHRLEQKSLQDELHQISQAKPGVLEQMASIKESLQHLVVSPSVYREYASIPESKRSIHEHVCVQVHELLADEKQRHMKIATESDGLRDQIVELETIISKLRRENDNIRKSSSETAEDSERRIKHLESMNRQLSRQVESLQYHMDETKGKSAMYDDVRAHATEVERDLEKARSKLMESTSRVDVLKEEKENNQSTLTDLRKQVELMRADNEHLTRQLVSAQTQLTSTEHSRDRLTIQVRDLQQAKDELVANIVRLQHDSKLERQQTIESEVKILKERMQQEMDRVHTQERRFHEREAAALRDARDRAVQQHRDSDIRYENMLTAHAKLQRDHRELQATADVEAGDGRTQLKLKEFEVERLTLLLTESNSKNNRLEKKAAVSEEQNKLLHDEYQKLEADYTRRVAMLEAQIETLRESIRTYEQLETQIEEATWDHASNMEDLQTGANHDNGVDDPDQKHESSSSMQHRSEKAQRELNEFVSRMPQLSRSRMKQNVLLARRVIDKQRELDSSQRELRSLSKKLESAQAQLADARAQLRKVQKPQSYLIDRLQRTEKENARMSKALKQTNSQHSDLCARYDRAMQQIATMRENMTNLDRRYRELQHLKTSLLRKRRGSVNASSRSRPSSRHQSRPNTANNNLLTPVARPGSGSVMHSFEENVSPSAIMMAQSAPALTPKFAQSHSAIQAHDFDQPQPIQFRKQLVSL
jgi:progesterone-induced-blocking factor 1